MLLVVALFVGLDGPSLVIAIGALAAVGCIVFALDARQPARRGVACARGRARARGLRRCQRRPPLATATRCCGSSGRRESADFQHDYEKWNAFSRVTVDGVTTRSGPSGVGLSRRCPPRHGRRARHGDRQHRGHRADPLHGRPVARRDYLRYDITNLAHDIRSTMRTSSSSGSAADATSSPRSSSTRGPSPVSRSTANILDDHERGVRRLHRPPRPRPTRRVRRTTRRAAT